MPSTISAESVFDDFWAIGLNRTAICHTEYRNWLGKNIMGKLLEKIAGENIQPRRSVSVPTNLQMSEQRNISDMPRSISKSDAKKKTSEKRSQNRAQKSRSARRTLRKKSNKNTKKKECGLVHYFTTQN